MNLPASPSTITSLPRASLRIGGPHEALFNEHNLLQYRDQLQQGLALVQRTLATVDRPFTGVTPSELRERFVGVNLDQPLPSLTQALDEVETLYLRDAVYFHHPRYAAHLNCPVLNVTLLAELLLSAINTSMDTWDQSAGATLIEQKLVDWTAERLGLGKYADGVFTSGGTQSNLMALLLARDSICAPHYQHGGTRHHGLPEDFRRLRIFASQASHFSVRKAAALLGLGFDAVVAVECDQDQRMDVAALTRALDAAEAAGLWPMAVVATAGTTDFCSIDPLTPIAAVCRPRGLWLHVDAAYGGGLMVSRRHRARLAGIEQADSVTVDYHKAFFQPVSCSAFLVRDRSQLAHLTYHADYLNPSTQAAEGIPNLVEKSLQTTRRFDALKLWLSLRTVGADAIGELFDQVMALAQYGHTLLTRHACFELAHPAPELSTLVFRFRPHGWDDGEALDMLNQRIRRQLARSGEAVIAGTRVNGRQYLKFTLLNPQLGEQGLSELIALVRAQGERLALAVVPAEVEA